MADTAVLDYLKKQILASSNTSAWTGQGFGSADANAADMARILADAGITNINQFGQQTVQSPTFSWEGGMDGGVYQTGSTSSTQYINKSTGQIINPSYDRAGGNIWSGTFAGSGSTGYGVQFDASGNPQFYTQYGGSTSDAGTIAPILSMVATAMGLPADIGSMLAGGSSAAIQAAVGNAVVGGTIGAATGGDPLKSALYSGASGYYGTELNNALNANTDFSKTTNAMITGAATGGTGALLTGGNVLQGAVLGGASAYASDLLNGDKALTAEAKAADRAAGLDRTYGSNDVYDTFMTNAMNQYNDATAADNTYGSTSDTLTVTGSNDKVVDAGALTVAGTGSKTKDQVDAGTLTVTGTGDKTKDQVDAGTLTVTGTSTKTDDTKTSTVINGGTNTDTTKTGDTTKTDDTNVNTNNTSIITTPTNTTTAYQILTANPTAAGSVPTYGNSYGQLDVAANDVAQRLMRGRSSTILTGGRGEDESKLSTSNILLGR